MSQQPVLFVFFALILGFGCAPKKTFDSSTVVQSAGAPLPVVGTWIAESYDGFSYNALGEKSFFKLDAVGLRNEDWQVETQIDQSGRGVFKTILTCEKTALAKAVKPSKIPVAWSPDIFPSVLQFRNCDSGKEVSENGSQVFLPASENSVGKNLGIKNNPKSLKAQCDELRGKRYVSQATPSGRRGADGCLGFSDAAANKLALILLPRGEIHGLRIDFKRIK